MKTTTLKKFSAFIVMMLSIVFSYAQTCTGNKVWACRMNCSAQNGYWQECKCIVANNVTQWQASAHTCGGNNGGCPGNNAYCGGRLSLIQSSEEMAFGVFPGSVTSSATIACYTNEMQRVVIKLYNMTGQHVKTLLDNEIEAGYFEMNWNTDDINAGIYVIRMEAAKKVLTEKISVLK